MRKRVVTSILAGGLGNQMFQYAAGRALSLRRACPLQLDVSLLARPSHVTSRPYQLDGFILDAELVSSYRHAGIERLRALMGLAPPVWRHTAFRFDPTVLDLPGYVRLLGFWQSEKYFEDCADVIRGDFAFREPPRGENAAVADEISASNAVSVHVRRGDYVSNPDVNRYHGTLPLEYYRAAAERVRRSEPDATFFVFSDDPTWCRTHLQLDAPVRLIDHNQQRPVADLQLMSQCRHHIIANSTMSWWGAWLSAGRDNPVVIAPQRWAAAEDVGPDLIPKHWIRL